MEEDRSSSSSSEHTTRRGKSIPEKVHEFYYKMFPGADCPVTGAARDKLISAASRASPSSSRSSPSQVPPTEAASCSSSSSSQPPGESKPKYKHPHVYDVYGRRIDQAVQEENSQVWRMPLFLYSTAFYKVPLPQPQHVEINPANRMPKHPNQQPAPGQKEPLSTYRQQSTIPKAGTDETWLYPSPQMFYNSLVRKNKADDVTERDMYAVVATHNSVNEATWSRLLQWENMYAQMYPSSLQEEPRLLHFKGRPHDLTPKAYIKKMLGYGVPFDRHDWTVDRGGREMRYIIDFYYDETKDWPFFVDVRPALDSPAAVLLRARMMMQELAGEVASPVKQVDAPKNVDSHGTPS